MVVWRFVIMIAFGVMLLQCGGSKKITSEEYDQLSDDEQIVYLEQQVKKNKKDIALKKQLYEAYLNKGMNLQALEVMEDIIVLDPYQIDVMYEYGELQYKVQNYDPAYRSFLRVLESSSGDLYKSRISGYMGGSYTEQQVTSKAVDEGFPYFSPDGKNLIYQVRSGDNWNIVEMDLSSRTETVVVDSPADEELPCYSPTGNQVIFTSTANDRRPIDAKYKRREITLFSRDDGFEQNLTQSVADDWLPRYSHDGSKILFVSERSDLRKVSYTAKQSDVYIMDSNGAFQLRLTKTAANEGGASFSADDRRVFFHSNRNGNYDIFVMKTNGEQVMTIVDNKDGNDVNPSASSDSASIAFMSDRDGNFEIYRANTDGSAQERLTFSEGVDANPVFSPDGRAIAFHSNRSGNFDIYIINLGDASEAALTKQDLIDKLNRLIQ